MALASITASSFVETIGVFAVVLVFLGGLLGSGLALVPVSGIPTIAGLNIITGTVGAVFIAWLTGQAKTALA